MSEVRLHLLRETEGTVQPPPLRHLTAGHLRLLSLQGRPRVSQGVPAVATFHVVIIIIDIIWLNSLYIFYI